MYFGDRRVDAEQTSQQIIDLDTGKRYKPAEADVLLGKGREMGVGLTLTKATIVILCEPTFNAALLYQMPRRAHRYGQKNVVVFYTLIANTMIEKLVDRKREKNAHTRPPG